MMTPLITRVQVFADRVVVEDTFRGIRSFLYTNVPANVIKQGAANVESFINAWLDDPARDFCQSANGRHFYAAVHVVTLEPLALTICLSDLPITDPNWWLTR